MQLRNNNESGGAGAGDGDAGICLPTETQNGHWIRAAVSVATQLSLRVVSQQVDIGYGGLREGEAAELNSGRPSVCALAQCNACQARSH